MSDDDEQPSDDPSETAIGRFAISLDKLVSYHVTEYDMPAAAVIGVLVLETFRRVTDAIKANEDDNEDEETDE